MRHRGELAEQMGLRARGTESQELIDACKSDGTDAQLACELKSRGLQEADECVERHAPQLAVKRKQILCRARDASLDGINPLLDEYCADSRLSP